MGRILKIFGLSAVILALVIYGALVYRRVKSGPGQPPMLTANFIDLGKVEKISKFRSCQGHTVVPQDESESKRSMKHYVVLKPENFGGGKVAIYAPFDGEVRSIRSEPEKGLEGEIWLGIKGSRWELSLEHLAVVPEIKEGKRVKAGQTLGYAADKGVDVVYAIGSNQTKTIDGYESPYLALDSVFNHMSAGAFREYQDRGIGSQYDLVYEKEYRDQNPCQYRDQQGGLNDFEHPEDWVFLK